MTKSDPFEEILDQCLAELESGQADPAELAARYPEQPDLGALLNLAVELRAVPLPSPDLARLSAASRRVRRTVRALPTEAARDFQLTTDRGGEHRRRYSRTPVTIQGILRLVRADDPAPRRLPITILDVSPIGLGFHSPEGIRPGDTVEIELPWLPAGLGAAAESPAGPSDGMPAEATEVPVIRSAAQVVYCAAQPLVEAPTAGRGYRAGAIFAPAGESPY